MVSGFFVICHQASYEMLHSLQCEYKSSLHKDAFDIRPVSAANVWHDRRNV